MCNKSKHIELFWLPRSTNMLNHSYTSTSWSMHYQIYFTIKSRVYVCIYFCFFWKKKSVHDRMINRSELAIITHQAWSMYERINCTDFSSVSVYYLDTQIIIILHTLFFYRKEIESKPFWGHSFFFRKTQRQYRFSRQITIFRLVSTHIFNCR